MSEFRPQNTRTGGLPHLSFIEKKPEPLGPEPNNLGFGKTGLFIGIKLKIGKNDRSVKYWEE